MACGWIHTDLGKPMVTTVLTGRLTPEAPRKPGLVGYSPEKCVPLLREAWPRQSSFWLVRGATQLADHLPDSPPCESARLTSSYYPAHPTLRCATTESETGPLIGHALAAAATDSAGPDFARERTGAVRYSVSPWVRVTCHPFRLSLAPWLIQSG
jgi:hypothetical protein